MEDGQDVDFEGSSSTYKLSRKGDVYSCTCPAWRNQGATIDRRTCKHLRAYLGEDVEVARVGSTQVVRGGSGTVRAAGSSGGGGGGGGGSAKKGEKETAPPVLLAHKWETDHDPTGWWMSEKLDGVRAYWDGEGFLSRQGNKFFAPDWFVADLPADTLDGELWVDRKQFSKTISIVRSGAGGVEWKKVQYVVFDAPNAKGGFEERIAHAKAVLERAEAKYARALEHVVCGGIDHLKEELERVEGLGGEGLMLRQPKSKYAVGRSTTLLKVKTFHDAEAKVTGHAAGAGKHKGRLGALECVLPSGATFNIGTGFSDAERDDPPPIGSIVTFRYQELTDDGVPRFPSWVGVRIDAEWPPRSEARPVGKIAKGSVATEVPAVEPEPEPEPEEADATAADDDADDAPAAKPAADFLVSLVHPGENKFWEIEVRGATQYTRFGKIGSPGQTRLADIGSATAAKTDADKRAMQKRKEGYVAKKR